MATKIVENLAYRDRVAVFKDRFEAGKQLAEKLKQYAGNPQVIILAVPAGGVPVGHVIAKELAAPLDVVVVRKIQIPWIPEAGFGAVSWDGKVVLNQGLVEQLGLTKTQIEESIAETKRNIEERLRKFRDAKSQPQLRGKVVVLVDDGLASGFTMLAAVRSVRGQMPEKIIVAVPTASMGAIELLEQEVDEIVCLNIRSDSSFAVADAYVEWYDLTDREVQILAED